MTIDIDELAADAAEQIKTKPALSLEQVIALAERLKGFEYTINSTEEYLSNLKKEWRELAEKTLPEAMLQLGLNSLGLKDGSTIGITDIVSASIKDENREVAHQWLRLNGYGDLIKNEVVVSFGKDEDKEAERIFKNLAPDFPTIRQEKVHPQTLNAQVRSWIKEGVAFPADTFKLYVGQQARLNQPKKGK